MIKKAIFNWLRKSGNTSSFAACFSLKKGSNSYLNEVGWFESFYRAMPVAKNGVAMPWYTYAATDFLESRVEGNMTVFEYGSGNSTIWWAKRVTRVISCEHDQQWFFKMKPVIPENVEYLHVNLSPGGEYSKTILNYNDEFDVIVIDGKDRINCAKNSLKPLKDHGVIIWDNSDREKYQDGYRFLIDNGFRRLDFTGFGPINVYGWCTSLFYRDNNCLGV